MGETARTTFERGGEHLNDLLSEVDGQPLWEHVKEDHERKYEKHWFKMKMTKKHHTALQRQIREALDIEGSGADIILNKKCEWNGSKIPRLRVEVGDTLEDEKKEIGRNVGEKQKIKEKFSSVKRKINKDDPVQAQCRKKIKIKTSDSDTKGYDIDNQENLAKDDIVSINTTNDLIVIVELDDDQTDTESKVQVDIRRNWRT